LLRKRQKKFRGPLFSAAPCTVRVSPYLFSNEYKARCARFNGTAATESQRAVELLRTLISYACSMSGYVISHSLVLSSACSDNFLRQGNFSDGEDYCCSKSSRETLEHDR